MIMNQYKQAEAVRYILGFTLGILAHVRQWWLVYVALAGAFFSISLGIWGKDFAAGCASEICNVARTVEWEAMSAGLFGLSGGLAAIVVIRQQINTAVEIGIWQRVDTLLVDINKQLAKVEDFCVACQLFVEEADDLLQRMETQDETELGEVISELIAFRRGERPIAEYLLIGRQLLDNRGVPAAIADSFERTVAALERLYAGLQGGIEMANLQDYCATLSDCVDKTSAAMWKHKRRILKVRMPSITLPEGWEG
ncbi:MAG: hypothetical protein GYB52_06815 [Rhodospirillales bacterium]|nr:hypothetical protein [Rhodospirillales bacterium]MBR9816325.1 hypothetical protein [Rhodospirillales bacterium]